MRKENNMTVSHIFYVTATLCLKYKLNFFKLAFLCNTDHILYNLKMCCKRVILNLSTKIINRPAPGTKQENIWSL